MNNFNLRDFSFSKLALPLSPTIQNHVGKVYSNLFQMLLITTIACYFHITYQGWLLESLSWFSFLGCLACLIGFYMTDELRHEKTSKILLFGFAAFKGLAIGPLINAAIYVNPSILLAALGSSVLVFASLSASVLFSPVPSRFYLTGMILSTVSVSFWLTIINLFMQSSALFTLELYLGLFLFSLYVLLDTEVMIRKAEDGSKQYLRHSMDLYVDAISIFIRILVILLRKDEEKERKKRNRK